MQFSEMDFITIIQFLLFIINKKVNSSKLFTDSSKNSREALPNIRDLKLTTTNLEGECVRLIQCKYICFNGSHSTIERNVNNVHGKDCTFISELHLLNYQFPGKILPKKLLGSIADKVNHLSIHSSDIEHIDPGAFDSQTLTGVHLENLKLKYIDKGIFKNVSEQFTSFTLIQTNPKLRSVKESLLEYIKYQIKKLTIQTGLTNVENLTGSQSLLNNLDDVDLSYNNFGGTLKAGSFNQLSVVRKLNLTQSAITYLPECIFDGIVVTLRVLDLSNNKLLVVGRNIFGSRSLLKGLTLYLNGNPWECTCDLQRELTTMLAFQEERVYCGNIENVLVTSETICPVLVTTTPIPYHSSETNLIGPEEAFNFKETSKDPVQTTELLPHPTASQLNAYATTHELECHKDNGKLETETLSIHWPNTQFEIVKKKVSEVDIVVRKSLNETYGVLWFSKVTLQYYKMETNHNEYGLGCYGRVEQVTTINHLLPDMTYTFCLILKDHLTVSPFSCKSVYIDDNSDINYNVWLTTNMKATGIGIMIIVTIIFMFLGVFSAFVLLKHKPSLLKGSKRVAMQKSDASNIIVFPEDKTLQQFKLREEQLANRKLRGFPFQRLSSVSINSLDSIQSYMNPENVNIYEIIPGHQSSLNVRYAEIPCKRKRSSNDPLPEIPDKVKDNISPYYARSLDGIVDQNYEKEVFEYYNNNLNELPPSGFLFGWSYSLVEAHSSCCCNIQKP